MTVTLDNLLKGAATQAIQNANLCMGLNEFQGINTDGNIQELAAQNPATIPNDWLRRMVSMQRQQQLTRTHTWK